MKHEIMTSDNRLPSTRRRRFGRVVRYGAYALGALLVLKIAMVLLSIVVSAAVVAVVVAIVAAVVALVVRR